MKSTRFLVGLILFVWLLGMGSAGPSGATPLPGPDDFGYVARSLTPELRDVSDTGTLVSLADNRQSITFPIGFSFEFYGVEFTVFRISSNGFITLGSAPQGHGCCSGRAIPDTRRPNRLIAAWWEDFNDPQGNIRFETRGVPGSRELVVGYYEVPHASGGPPVTWEIVLHEGVNTIEIQCWSCPSDGGTHSIGIENLSGDIGLQVARTTNSLPRSAWLLAVNQAPICTNVQAVPDVLWPSNEMFVPISVAGVSEPDGDSFTLSIESIFQDESLENLPERILSADAWGIGSETAHVRAERSGHGDGRVYHVGFRAEDSFGATCSGTVTSCVPHESFSDCVDQGPLYDSTRPPSLEASDPEPGSVEVPRTAWLSLTLDKLRRAVRGSLDLRCDGIEIGRSVFEVSGDTVIVNPDQELPPGSVCRVRWEGPGGLEEFFFATAAGSGAEEIRYDRRDPDLVAPFPDDYWLVHDSSTPSGKRLQLEVGELGSPEAAAWFESTAAAIAHEDGFSPYQSAVIDTSESIEAASIPADAFDSLDPFAPVALFDMDPASDGFGARVPFTITVRSDEAADGSFDHSAILFPATTLELSGTYALVLTNRLHAAGDAGRPFFASDFFSTVAQPASPGEAPEAARARESIEPVLAFLESVPEVPIPREDVALALRISIRSQNSDLAADMVAIKEAYLAAPPPVLNVESIVSTAERAAVVRGTVELPFYIGPGPDDLGAINRDPETGEPVPLGFESVPFLISLPDEALTGPVPIAIFAHGGNQSRENILLSFNEFLDDAGYAIGGITNLSSRLYANPWRDAQLLHLLHFQRLPLLQVQAEVDLLGFLRALQGLADRSFLPAFAPDDLPEIDPTRILFRGGSRGALLGLGFLTLAPEVTAAEVFSGSGRDFENMVHRGARGRLLRLVPGLRQGQALVSLAALQSDADRYDPYFRLKHLYQEPLVIEGLIDAMPPNLLYLESTRDSGVSNTAHRATAQELGIPLVRPVQGSTPVLVEVDAPLAENIAPDVTGGFFQYDPLHTPSCRDIFMQFNPHICVLIALEAEIQTLHFFETALDPEQPAEIIDPFLLGTTLTGEDADSGLTPLGGRARQRRR